MSPTEGGYQGQYIIDWAAQMPEGADPLEWGEAHALADQRRVLGSHERARSTHWFSERAMVATGAIDDTLADLRERGVVYDDDGAVWLRSTDFGDDKDRVLVKSDGEYTYLLPDIAYHRDKFARGFDLLINVLGRRPPRLRAADEGRRRRRWATTPTTSRSSSPSWSASSRAAKRSRSRSAPAT